MKRRLYNISKWKLSAGNHIPEIIAISFMNKMGKKDLLTSIPIPILDKSVIDIAIIGTNTYCAACKFKEAQFFAFSMKDLEFQVAKEVKLEIDPKCVIPEEYYDLLDIFLKRDSDILLSYQKNDYKIIVEEEQKYGYSPLYKISLEELDAVKCYLDSHLTKRFIQAISALYFSSVLFIKKSGRRI